MIFELPMSAPTCLYYPYFIPPWPSVGVNICIARGAENVYLKPLPLLRAILIGYQLPRTCPHKPSLDPMSPFNACTLRI